MIGLSRLATKITNLRFKIVKYFIWKIFYLLDKLIDKHGISMMSLELVRSIKFYTLIAIKSFEKVISPRTKTS